MKKERSPKGKATPRLEELHPNRSDFLSVSERPLTPIVDNIQRTQGFAQGLASHFCSIRLEKAFDSYKSNVEAQVFRSGDGLPKNTPTGQLQGNVFEAHHDSSYDVNAAANDSIFTNNKATMGGDSMPNGSVHNPHDTKADIRTWKTTLWDVLRGRGAKETGEYQAKSSNSWGSARDQLSKVDPGTGQGQYKGTGKVTNSEHVKPIKTKPIPKTATGPKAEAYDHTKRTVTETVTAEGVSSDPLTHEESTQMTEAAKERQVEYSDKAGKRLARYANSMKSGVAAGAIVGVTVATVRELIVLSKRNDLSEKRFIEAAQNILLAGVDGGARAGVLITANHFAAQLIGESMLGTAAVTGLTSMAYDFAKSYYQYLNGRISGDDLLITTVQNVTTTGLSTAASFGGAAAGQAIALSLASGASAGSVLGPAGALVGSLICGFTVGIAMQYLIKTASKDGSARVKKDLDAAMAEITRMTEEMETIVAADPNVIPMHYVGRIGTLSEKEPWSFKSFIPMYNVFADMEEYRQRRIILRNLREQLEADRTSLATSYGTDITQMEREYSLRVAMLEEEFRTTRSQLYGGVRENLDSIASEYRSYALHIEQGYHLIGGERKQLLERQAVTSVSLQAARSRLEARTILLNAFDEMVDMDAPPATRDDARAILDKVLELCDEGVGFHGIKPDFPEVGRLDLEDMFAMGERA
jgi:hypothetical protein